MRRSHIAAGMLALLLVVPALAAVPAAAQEPSTKLLVLGETHGTRSVTRDLVGVAASKGATGCVCPGDFIYGHWETSPWAWRDMMRPFMGKMMPAQGNHDWPWSDWSSLFPNGAHYYAKDVDGVQFISVNTEYSLAPGSTQRNWLEARLNERDAGALKVVFMHRPWWLPDGARHPASEFASKNGAQPADMSRLMERTGVDLVVSAHEKNYQHSLTNGVHYLVAGGGGPEFYGMGYHLPDAVKRLQSNVVSTLDVSASSMTLKSYDRWGGKVEEFTMTRSGATTSSPTTSPPTTGSAAVTFAPHDGNEWWVQTRFSGSDAWRVRSVEARDGSDAWQPLSLRSWGSWATSFRVEPGNAVTYRATLDDGRVVTSCAYAHPSTTCTTAAPTAPTQEPASSYAASFRNARGNAWWVEVDVTADGLATVEARSDGGAWIALSKTSWGSYAKSFRAGSSIEFRATSTSGAHAVSQAYAWPPR